MKIFTEQMRYEYDLNPNSTVIDLGLYQGNFSRIIYEKYGCNVYAFEPIKQFYEDSKNSLVNCPKVKVFNYGIGGSTREETIAVRNDSSSIFSESEFKEVIQIRSIKEAVQELQLNEVDLIKINIEGCEYELLECVLDNGMANIFKNIQVQFHSNVLDAISRRETIRQRLTSTHHLTYDCEFIWENWERN